MRLFGFVCLTICATLYTSCQKDNSGSSSTTEEETCATARGSRNGEVVEGQYIVSYNEASGMQRASPERVAGFSGDVLRRNAIASPAIKASFGGEVSGFVATLSKTEVARLSADASIAMIEPDRIVSLATCFTVVAPNLVTWNITKVGYGDGTGKTAWVIDSGIDLDHPDLTVDQTRSRSFLSGNTSADDENGHGTHVAGIIGGKNNTIGVLGVASGATVVSLKVLDKDGEGLASGIIQALSYVSTNGKAGDVVNMSLGEEDVSQILDNQVKAVAAKGIYVSMAAGNESQAANLTSPGRTNGTNIYTVSAVDSLNNFASFSNFGNDVVDFAAPGVRILSTYSNGRYARASGTSMAAPHVAGLLLLVGNNVKSSGTAMNDPDGTPDRVALKQ